MTQGMYICARAIPAVVDKLKRQKNRPRWLLVDGRIKYETRNLSGPQGEGAAGAKTVAWRVSLRHTGPPAGSSK